MAEYDISFKIASHSSGREMCWLRGIRPDVWEPIGDTLQTTERLADRAFCAEQAGQRFVVYFEAYTEWRPEDVGTFWLRVGCFPNANSVRLAGTLLFLLTPKGYQAHHGTFRFAIGDEATQQVWFREICLWLEQPEAWWEQVPSLMALLPLCNHGRAEDDVVKYAVHHITAQVEDTIVRANMLASLGFLGKLRYPQLNAFELIGRENMRESSFYQDIVAEGQVLGRREDVLEALAVRFGEEAAAEFRDALDTITEPAKLSKLHRTAIKCRGIGGFRRALQARDS